MYGRKTLSCGMLSRRYQLFMSSGTLYRVRQVTFDVSENTSPPSSGFLIVIGPHSCVTVESLLISLSTEGHYVWSKNSVLWDAFTAVTIIDYHSKEPWRWRWYVFRKFGSNYSYMVQCSRRTL
jgi:hypothetical protein